MKSSEHYSIAANNSLFSLLLPIDPSTFLIETNVKRQSDTSYWEYQVTRLPWAPICLRAALITAESEEAMKECPTPTVLSDYLHYNKTKQMMKPKTTKRNQREKFIPYFSFALYIFLSLLSFSTG